MAGDSRDGCLYRRRTCAHVCLPRRTNSGSRGHLLQLRLKTAQSEVEIRRYVALAGFPAHDGADGHAQQPGKLRLTEAVCFAPRLDLQPVHRYGPLSPGSVTGCPCTSLAWPSAFQLRSPAFWLAACHPHVQLAMYHASGKMLGSLVSSQVRMECSAFKIHECALRGGCSRFTMAPRHPPGRRHARRSRRRSRPAPRTRAWVRL